VQRFLTAVLIKTGFDASFKFINYVGMILVVKDIAFHPGQTQ
jgi:hypothetical protein